MILRSCRDVRRPRHLPNAKTAAILQSHPEIWNKHVQRTCLMYHAACKVEFQPFNMVVLTAGVIQLYINLIQMGTRKQISYVRISETLRPGRYPKIKLKNRQKTTMFIIRTNTPAEYVLPGISYVRAETPPYPQAVSLLFILTWRGVPCRFLVSSSTPA